MSKSSIKKTAKQNKETMKILFVGEVLSTLFFIFLIFLKSKSVFQLIKSFPELLAIYLLYKWSQPRFDAQKKLISAGTALNSRGVVLVCFDFVYFSWIIKILSLFSNLWYLGYVLFWGSVAKDLYGMYRKFYIHN